MRPRVTADTICPCSVEVGIETPTGSGSVALHVLRPKDILIVCLALSSGALAILALSQRAEIQRLANGDSTDRFSRSVPFAIHNASKRTLFVPPRQLAGDAEQPSRGGEEDAYPALFLSIAGEGRADPTRSRKGGGLVRLMENPEFVQALGLQRHAMLDARFAGLFRTLNLAPNELAAFKNLLVEKENVVLDVVTVSETLPDGPLPTDTLRASVRAAQAQVEQAIHSSLGSERYAIYREYERTLAQRATVAQLEQRLSYTDSPLAPAQADALVRILAAHSPSTTPVEAPPVVSVLVRAGVPEAVPILPTSASTGRVTEDVVVRSQAVLAPPQLQALRELQAEQQAAMRAAELIRQVAPTDAAPNLGIIPFLQ